MKNDFTKKLTRNVSLVFLANFLSVLIATILALIVPKFISISDYSYWQLYIFYAAFTTYLSFGIPDGAYLRYGGYEYNNINKTVFIPQFWFLVILSIILNLSVMLTYISNSTDSNKSIVVLLTCLTGVLVVPRLFLVYILQGTNRIKEYSISIILERGFYFLLVVLFLILGIKEFKYLIISDIVGKLVSLIYVCFVTKELVFGKIHLIGNSIREFWTNLSVGINLLFANLANLLIIGIVRICIENNWSINIFGQVSMALSIANMFLLFINAIGLSLFPMLRRTSEDNLAFIYKIMRTVIVVPLLGLLILYFPMKSILSLWLPEYTDSFIYMILLLPMCVFESKTQMLINTYLKTLRKEKMMLVINVITVVISLIITFINVFILNNLHMSIISITLLIAFRSIFAELYLAKKLDIKVSRDVILEITMTMIFIMVAWNLNYYLALIIYLGSYIIYVLMERNEILSTVKDIKLIINSETLNTKSVS